MAKKRKPTKFLDLKLIGKFLRDYQKMPYKSKSVIMTAVLVVLLIPLVLIYPFGQTSTAPSLDLAPLEVVPSSTQACYITGCANHLCLDAKIEAPVTTCDHRPEFQCLTQAKCELQPSGRCGWTQTPEYLSCLADLSL